MATDEGGPDSSEDKGSETSVPCGLDGPMHALVVSVHMTSAIAFEELGFSTFRVRPSELTRGGFDLLLESMKSGAFGLVWIDMNTPRFFAGSSNVYHQACQRLRILLTTAGGVDVPMCFASSNSGVLEMQEFQDLFELLDLKVTHHNWCAFGIEAGTCGASSSVVHRCVSDWPLTDTPCACDPSIEHVNNLALRDVTCTSQHRQQMERDAIVGLLCAAWFTLEAGSYGSWTRPAKPADSVAVRRTEKPVKPRDMPKAKFCSSYVECPSCQLHQPIDTAFCRMCEVEVLPHEGEVGDSLEPSFPTEQKIAAKERAKAGHVPIVARSKLNNMSMTAVMMLHRSQQPLSLQLMLSSLKLMDLHLVRKRIINLMCS